MIVSIGALTAASGLAHAEEGPSAVEEPTATAEDDQQPSEDGEEEEEPPDPNRWEWAPFPSLGGNTDIGFKFGVNLAVARLAEGYTPYRFRINVIAVLSVKSSPEGGTDFPEHCYMLNLDFPGLVGGRLRIITEAGFQRVINAGYYGLGGVSLDDPLGRVDLDGGRRHQFIRQMPVANIDFRWRLGELPLELLFGAHFRYMLPSAYDESLVLQDAELRRPDGTPLIIGFEDHALVMGRVGLLWDGRDHEIAPTRGFYAELSTRVGLGVPAPDRLFGFGAVTADLRAVASLLDDHRLVFATRLLLDWAFGDVPFYQLSRMGTFYRHGFGDAKGVRGLPEGRYSGELKLLGAVELRSLFAHFRLFGIPMVFGMMVNFTVGQIWATGTREPPFDDAGSTATWGAGYALLLRWGESVMIRIEVDYSPAATDGGLPVGIYFGLGHAF